MQQLIYVMFQLDEARRYIEDGRIERLRLALLLLDNAIEIQMERRIRNDLMYEQIRENLRNKILETPQDGLPESLREIVNWNPLSKKQKIRIDRFFNEKLIYLSERSKHLNSRLVEPISYLHRYRNEAYHRSVTRPATIRTAAVLMLEINCYLLTSIPIPSSCYASDEDYSWIAERFNISPMHFTLNGENINSAAESIRGGVIPEKSIVISTLVEHLESRVEEFYESLDFIVENTKFTDREDALIYCQYYESIQNSELDPKAVSPDEYTPRFTLNSIDQANAKVANIVHACDNVDAFYRFSVIEREIEPIERIIYSAYMEVEAMIQREIDLARGK